MTRDGPAPNEGRRTQAATKRGGRINDLGFESFSEASELPCQHDGELSC